MCLFVNQIRTEKFNKDNKLFKRIKVYKVLGFDKNNRLITPYIGTRVKFGFLKAGPGRNGSRGTTNVIEGGAVHCYEYKHDAEIWGPAATCKCCRCYIVEGWAYTCDYIASGNRDFCFKKIYIPKPEIERIKKLYKQRFNPQI